MFYMVIVTPSKTPIKPATLEYGQSNEQSTTTLLIVAGALNTPNKPDIFPVALDEQVENESSTVKFSIL